MAHIAGFPGVYTCDGGCDRATINQGFAKQIAKSGVKVQWYQKPKPALLADGRQRNIIIGHVKANIDLKTGAGAVKLPNRVIDILRGKDDGNMLLIGREEEKSLGLRSFKEQLDGLNGNLQTINARQAQLAAHKRSLRAGTQLPNEMRVNAGLGDVDQMLTDGECYVGERDWQAGTLTNLHVAAEPGTSLVLSLIQL